MKTQSFAPVVPITYERARVFYSRATQRLREYRAPDGCALGEITLGNKWTDLVAWNGSAWQYITTRPANVAQSLRELENAKRNGTP